MRRINPIEWTSGCSHCPAVEAGASSRAAANCIPQTLGAAEDPASLGVVVRWCHGGAEQPDPSTARRPGPQPPFLS